MSFFGYKRDMDPDAGPLATSKLYRFIAGFACAYIGPFAFGGHVSVVLHSGWVFAFGVFLGYGAMREGMGFINHILFWRSSSEDINLFYLLAFFIFCAGLLFFKVIPL